MTQPVRGGMPVILRLPEVLRADNARTLPPLRLSLWHGAALGGFVLMTSIAAGSATGPVPPASVLVVLARWTPLLLRGFGFNILISFMAMAIGTVLGAFLGLGLISVSRAVRAGAWALTQFFRNAPWLVLLFFMIYMLPFHVELGGLGISIPDWLKAVIGLALPVMANVAEVVRGGVQSIPPGQWEAAESLGFTRTQQLREIILPQSIKRMIPPWMNLYAILTMATTLAAIVGVSEVVTLAGQVQAAESNRTDLLAPLYGYVLLFFFFYSYPIAWLTLRLERRYAVRL
jgi:polar amino acid transport system permease protein